MTTTMVGTRTDEKLRMANEMVLQDNFAPTHEKGRAEPLGNSLEEANPCIELEQQLFELLKRRQENYVLHALAKVISPTSQVVDLNDEVELTPRRNMLGMVENVMEGVLHHNVQTKVQPTQIEQETTWYNKEHFLEERRLWEVCF